MENIFNYIRLALPFLEIAYSFALLVNPSVAADVRIAIDALKRAIDNAGSAVVARGYEAIKVFGDNIIAALNNLVDNEELEHNEKIRQAEDLTGSLSDPTKVYQARKGKDAELLIAFKSQANEKLTEIRNQGA